MALSASILHCMTLALGCALVGAEINPSASKTSPEASPTAVKFILMGDMPYSSQETTALNGDIRAAIAAAQVPFVVHYGDFKAGNESCTDEVFQDAKTLMESLHPQMIFTPGDNDWTDCDRNGLLEPLSELERLDTLREMFFEGREEAGITRQENYPENARWWHDGVLFSTFHMVGTDNGRKQILLDDPQPAITRVNARDQANQNWLSDAFEQGENAQALVLVMQADLSETSGTVPCSETTPTDCDPYLAFRRQLRSAAADFRDPQDRLKPVLLVHGDTFPFCLDTQFGGEQAPNLHRLNAWGDFQSPADVTEVLWMPEQTETPFQVQTLVNRIKPKSCSQN